MYVFNAAGISSTSCRSTLIILKLLFRSHENSTANFISKTQQESLKKAGLKKSKTITLFFILSRITRMLEKHGKQSRSETMHSNLNRLQRSLQIVITCPLSSSEWTIYRWYSFVGRNESITTRLSTFSILNVDISAWCKSTLEGLP